MQTNPSSESPNEKKIIQPFGGGRPSSAATRLWRRETSALVDWSTDGPSPAPTARHFPWDGGGSQTWPNRRWPQVPEPVLQQLDAEPPGDFCFFVPKTPENTGKKKKMDVVGHVKVSLMFSCMFCSKSSNRNSCLKSKFQSTSAWRLLSTLVWWMHQCPKLVV